jgi:hypothetical protein
MTGPVWMPMRMRKAMPPSSSADRLSAASSSRMRAAARSNVTELPEELGSTIAEAIPSGVPAQAAVNFVVTGQDRVTGETEEGTQLGVGQQAEEIDHTGVHRGAFGHGRQRIARPFSHRTGD